MAIHENTWQFIFATVRYNPCKIIIVWWRFMISHDHSWNFMAIHEDSCQSMTIHDDSWRFMTIHDDSWWLTRIHDNSRQFVMINEDSWQFKTICDKSWQFMTIHDYSWQFMIVMMVLDNLWRFMMTFYGTNANSDATILSPPPYPTMGLLNFTLQQVKRSKANAACVLGSLSCLELSR